MLHQKQNNKNIISNTEIKGIVLIDGMEKHLNVEWQEIVLNLLQETFSKVQFICSTNSKIVFENNFNSQINSL